MSRRRWEVSQNMLYLVFFSNRAGSKSSTNINAEVPKLVGAITYGKGECLQKIFCIQCSSHNVTWLTINYLSCAIVDITLQGYLRAHHQEVRLINLHLKVMLIFLSIIHKICWTRIFRTDSTEISFLCFKEYFSLPTHRVPILANNWCTFFNIYSDLYV
jgi:hypothetical protein